MRYFFFYFYVDFLFLRYVGEYKLFFGFYGSLMLINFRIIGYL